MKRKIIIYSIILCCTVGCNSSKPSFFQVKETKATTLNSLDGPYIYNTNDTLTVISVEKAKDTSFLVKTAKIKRAKDYEFISKINNVDKDQVPFKLAQKYTVPKDVHPPQDNIFVTSDIEGNFNTFYSMLIGNKVMDSNFNWIYGKGHLVICGDMFDRGTEILPCLWLLYKLEQQAKKNGGDVHYILGNHDVMNLYLDIRYVKDKYMKLARLVSGINDDDQAAYAFLMSDANELVKWIKTKNAIEKIGDNLFIHGGVSEKLIATGLSISEINDIVRKNIRKNLMKYPEEDEQANLIFGREGPFWYRGLIKGYKKYYSKIETSGLDALLNYFDVKHIIIGHTIVDRQVTSDFNGKVIRVDIKHPKEKFTGKSQALLIENGKYFKLSDKGDKFELDFNN
ncbi:metallophosphoesterase [Flavivirga eckloniae]|uniref:Metallophosphoesterase n=1 Tax=Flavivirga eckloniae TaxID=1803846 RepID=A0A2K9PPX6_9FLAO|nr:metallophosphoesterase [Flavivirga eckloniae]AUP79112.1 metallophosphoesterase [Flavivirga eckloniae]